MVKKLKIIATILVIIAAILLAVYFARIIAENNKLPEVTGKTLDEAAAELEKKGKGFDLYKDFEFSETVDKGFVTRIDPPSGEACEKNSKIIIYISRGKAITVSDFCNSNAETAKTALSSQGLSFSVNEEYSENVPYGNIISTNPAAGELVESGTNIELVISKGSEYRILPAYEGLSFTEFNKTASDLGLNLDEEYEFNPDIEKGYIISCDFSSGDKVSVNETIHVAVSNGSGVVVPEVIGLQQNSAKESLEKLGLVCEIKESYDDAAKGIVLRTSKNAGERVEEGTAITVTVSKGTEMDEFIGQCETISYDELIRNPSQYKSKKIKAQVEITNIEKDTFLGIEVSSSIWASYNGETVILDDVRKKPEPALREGDWVYIYGFANGTSTINVKEKKYVGSLLIGFSYDSTVDSFEVPNIQVKYVSFS